MPVVTTLPSSMPTPSQHALPRLKHIAEILKPSFKETWDSPGEFRMLRAGKNFISFADGLEPTPDDRNKRILPATQLQTHDILVAWTSRMDRPAHVSFLTLNPGEKSFLADGSWAVRLPTPELARRAFVHLWDQRVYIGTCLPASPERLGNEVRIDMEGEQYLVDSCFERLTHLSQQAKATREVVSQFQTKGF